MIKAYCDVCGFKFYMDDADILKFCPKCHTKADWQDIGVCKGDRVHR